MTIGMSSPTLASSFSTCPGHRHRPPRLRCRRSDPHDPPQRQGAGVPGRLHQRMEEGYSRFPARTTRHASWRKSGASSTWGDAGPREALPDPRPTPPQSGRSLLRAALVIRGRSGGHRGEAGHHPGATGLGHIRAAGIGPRSVAAASLGEWLRRRGLRLQSGPSAVREGRTGGSPDLRFGHDRGVGGVRARTSRSPWISGTRPEEAAGPVRRLWRGTTSSSPWKKPRSFDRRCIRAGSLRSALLLGRIAVLFTLRSALQPAPHRSRCDAGFIHGLL